MQTRSGSESRWALRWVTCKPRAAVAGLHGGVRGVQHDRTFSLKTQWFQLSSPVAGLHGGPGRPHHHLGPAVGGDGHVTCQTKEWLWLFRGRWTFFRGRGSGGPDMAGHGLMCGGMPGKKESRARWAHALQKAAVVWRHARPCGRRLSCHAGGNACLAPYQESAERSCCTPRPTA